MSETSGPTPQDIIQALQNDFIYQLVQMATLALPLYEYLITWDQEVELIWRRKTRFTVPSLLLVSTRICMVLDAILAVAIPLDTCTGLKVFYSFQVTLVAVGFIQTALFSALRISALYDRNATLFAVIFALGLVPVGTNLFQGIRTTYTQEPGVCIQDFDISDDLTRKLILVTRIPVIVANILVLALTWTKTYQQILHSRLLTCLARDGTVYFLALLVMDILQIVTFGADLGTPVAILVATLPPILINRFMLNLSQTGNSTQTDSTWNPDRSVVSTLGFQLSEQTVGSMGQSLDHGGSSVTREHEDEAPQEGLEASHGV